VSKSITNFLTSGKIARIDLHLMLKHVRQVYVEEGWRMRTKSLRVLLAGLLVKYGSVSIGHCQGHSSAQLWFGAVECVAKTRLDTQSFVQW